MADGIGGASDDKVREAAAGVGLLVLDVDGVMTDGSIILDNGGNELKRFHVRDGHGVKMLVRAGVKVAIITGRESKVVELRAAELGIHEVHQGCHDKLVAYEEVLRKFGLTDAEAAYVGDDIVDIPLLKRVTLPVAVADADPEAKRHALWVTSAPGGRGAVREVAELILKAKGLWDGILEKYD